MDVEELKNKHIYTISHGVTMDDIKKVGCGECQNSCQSACKTSCTVANQDCLNVNGEIKENEIQYEIE